MEKLKDIDTFYSQKVIPLAFNESLSYMEQICNLISYIENTLVPAINNNANAIKELQEYVQELKKLLDKLDEKINNVKEELTTLINNVNDTLTNAINNLDSKVVEHINASNEKFNALDTSIESINTNIDTINTNIDTINTNIDTINTEVETINTEVGTIKEQIQTINTNVTQNTNAITNLNNNIKPFQTTEEFTLIPTDQDYRFQLFMNNTSQKPTIINNIFYLTGTVNFTLKIKDEYLDQMLNKSQSFRFKIVTYGANIDILNNKKFNSLSCGFVQDITHNKISNLRMSLSNKKFNSDSINFTPTTQETNFEANLNLVAYLEEV